jgi:hypothetical protein
MVIAVAIYSQTSVRQAEFRFCLPRRLSANLLYNKQKAKKSEMIWASLLLKRTIVLYIRNGLGGRAYKEVSCSESDRFEHVYRDTALHLDARELI